MINIRIRVRFVFLFIFATIFIVSLAQENVQPDPETLTRDESSLVLPSAPVARKAIRSIFISGNNFVPKEALLARIPYQAGDSFTASKTGDLIRNLYSLNFFNNVTVDIDDISDSEIDLYIIVDEKKKIEAVLYSGNSALSSDEIEKKLKLTEIPTMDEQELALYSSQIKSLYAEKNYHSASVTGSLISTDRGTFEVHFTIYEGNKAVVKRICFIGNSCVSSKVLRSIIVTREDWIFGFVTKAGMFQPEMLDVDKYFIENYYQTNGFLAARVTDTHVQTDEISQCMTITYTIEEGDIFTIKSVDAQGNQYITSEQLIPLLPIRPGQLYSRELVRVCLEQLRALWGQYGHIYADIEPVIVPNFEDKTVEISFNTELGKTVTLNRIGIYGNVKTRDYVIRRMLSLCEGQMLTTTAMESSKSRIESLGFFEPMGGVEWKVSKISENEVDLDLMLKEAKTGSAAWQIGYGGADPQSPSTSIRIGGSLSDKNLFGTGIRANLAASWSKEDRVITLNFFQPWLFNKPIGGGLGFYHRTSIYDDFRNVNNAPREKTTGGDAQILFYVPNYPTISTSIVGGAERIQFQNNLRAERAGRSDIQVNLIQSFIDQRFISGTSAILGVTIGEDVRNHPMFPNRGYNWSFSTRMGIPLPGQPFGYFKGDFDATWLTPLIGDYDLIFLLHSHAGFVIPLGNKLIPYRDLYNVGGPGTVRGFDFGQIGPQIYFSSVGATRAFWVNAELIFSITQDQSLRGILFYDGGAGWNTPLSASQIACLQAPENSLALINNRFQYRHAIGIGLRALKPVPFRIDVGFKLDRNKRRGEKFYEVHLSGQQDF